MIDLLPVSLGTYKSHLTQVIEDLRDHEVRIFTTTDIEILVQQSKCWYIMAGEKILGVCGYIEIWKGVLEVFVLPCKSIKQHPVSFHKKCLETLAYWMTATRAHRLQTTSLANQDTDKWMTMLGFECEGTLKQYSATKQDYKQWARYK